MSFGLCKTVASTNYNLMLQEKLKAETKEQHDQLEKLMFVGDIMSRKLTIEQYRNLVFTNYLIHKQYENLIHATLSTVDANQLDLANRQKTTSLLADIEELGINTDELEDRNATTLLNNATAAYALGAMYVLEGATLGGSVIYKQLKLNPNFEDGFNFNYYTVYGKELLSKWQNFLQVLNALPDIAHQQAIDGANMMFEQIAKVAKLQKEQTV